MGTNPKSEVCVHGYVKLTVTPARHVCEYLIKTSFMPPNWSTYSFQGALWIQRYIQNVCKWPMH